MFVAWRHFEQYSQLILSLQQPQKVLEKSHEPSKMICECRGSHKDLRHRVRVCVGVGVERAPRLLSSVESATANYLGTFFWSICLLLNQATTVHKDHHRVWIHRRVRSLRRALSSCEYMFC